MVEPDYRDKLDEELKHLEKKFQTLAKLHFDNASNYKILLLGVLLGLLGGLFATLLYELVIASWSPEPKWLILILDGLLFAYFIYRFIKEMILSREKGLQVKRERDRVMQSFDS